MLYIKKRMSIILDKDFIKKSLDISVALEKLELQGYSFIIKENSHLLFNWIDESITYGLCNYSKKESSDDEKISITLFLNPLKLMKHLSIKDLEAKKCTIDSAEEYNIEYDNEYEICYKEPVDRKLQEDLEKCPIVIPKNFLSSIESDKKSVLNVHIEMLLSILNQFYSTTKASSKRTSTEEENAKLSIHLRGYVCKFKHCDTTIELTIPDKIPSANGKSMVDNKKLTRLQCEFNIFKLLKIVNLFKQIENNNIVTLTFIINGALIITNENRAYRFYTVAPIGEIKP